MIESFGGRTVSRFSKKTNFLLVGQGALPTKFKDATKRSVEVLNLCRLQVLLLGQISFQALKALPALTSDAFAGPAYQAAGAPPPKQETQPSAKKVPSASAHSDAKPAAATAEKATVVVPASSQALVARAPREDKGNTAAVVPRVGKKPRFTIPIPGVNGVVGGVLDGLRFVLTGVFPEVGGGGGLVLGKDRTKRMIESFGGKVTSAVSGKTDYLLVGQDPGRSKVSQADDKGIPLIDLLALQRLLLGQSTLAGMANEPPPRITNFSAGYPGQGMLGY